MCHGGEVIKEERGVAGVRHQAVGDALALRWSWSPGGEQLDGEGESSLGVGLLGAQVLVFGELWGPALKGRVEE